MIFTCLQENLSKGLSTVGKAVSLKSPLPVLSNVLVVAQDGRLKLTASNMETSITLYVGASVEKDGAITIPAKLFGEFISNLSPSTIRGELKENILHISTEKTKSKFNGVDASNYPALPEIKDQTLAIEVDPKEFAHAVMSVAFSAASDETRPVLTGVLVHLEGGVLTLATADGYRLSETSIKLKKTRTSEFNVIIPAKTLVEVARIFGSSGDKLKIVMNKDDNLALFEAEGTTVSTRIIDGNFPDYKKLIPAEAIHKAEFYSQDLLEAVKLTNVFAKGSETHSPITIHINPEGYIKLTSASSESGENHTQIDASVEGEVLDVVFNSKFLLDFLNNIKAERVVFSSNGQLTPGVVKGAETEGYIHLIMPIRGS
ncbi:DNA polymerase III subunit beta [candidate division WWE3 bacterium]|nr:DNA polymerase III subunit beta [candidate division WWE3 bacterium]